MSTNGDQHKIHFDGRQEGDLTEKLVQACDQDSLIAVMNFSNGEMQLFEGAVQGNVLLKEKIVELITVLEAILIYPKESGIE